jgi:1-pyrroline-5-carboxylate dehydrogenase
MIRNISGLYLTRRLYSNGAIPSWATVNPDTLSGAAPGTLRNLVDGAWRETAAQSVTVDPLNGEAFLRQPSTSTSELEPFVASLRRVPKSGVHNMFKSPEKYVMWGDVSARMASELRGKATERFFCRLIQRVMPKSDTQVLNEVVVTRKFLENFSGDQVRFLARSFGVAGDHAGQISTGLRWPYGPVAIVAPFNFPLEIPVLQLMGALYMGNKPVLKPSENVAVVVEQWARFMHACGAPLDAFDLIHCPGKVMGELLARAPLRMTQFTGSSGVAEHLARQLAGRIKIEDAGFDWKILGPDVPADAQLRAHVAWQCDQDAYAATGQKCSAQSILFVHDNWMRAGILDELAQRAAQRKLADLTVGPVLTHTTAGIIEHARRLASIPGARILFGAHELPQHTIPKQYGAVAPTAVFVPLAELLKPANYEHCTTEIFGPFQVVTSLRRRRRRAASSRRSSACTTTSPPPSCPTTPLVHQSHSRRLGQRHHLRPALLARTTGGAAEPLVRPRRRSARRRHRLARGDQAGVVVPPRGDLRSWGLIPPTAGKLS